MPTSRSARPFQERAGLVPTRRTPMPRADFGTSKLVDYPLVPPFPIPERLLSGQGDPPPDRAGDTQQWPYGDTT